jgi:hypothetical protein
VNREVPQACATSCGLELLNPIIDWPRLPSSTSDAARTTLCGQRTPGNCRIPVNANLLSGQNLVCRKNGELSPTLCIEHQCSYSLRTKSASRAHL